MLSIPNELLQNIFLYLSHKNIAQCGLVCKDWYIFSRTPSIFRTIRIYNKKQFDGFIKMATTEKINNQYIGQFVRNILLQDYCAGLTEEMKVEEIQQLYQACPNATFIDNIHTIVNTNLLEDTFWPSLSILPQWVQQRYPHWCQFLYNDQIKCTSLAFTINQNHVIERDHLGNNNNHNNTMDGDNDEEEQDGMRFIIFQKDEKPQKKRLLDYPVPRQHLLTYILINDENLFETINDEHFLIYYAKVMLFTPRMANSFQHLKQLTIDFGTYSQYLVRKPERTLELDERTIESIHQTCTSLTSLTIKNFYMNISPHYTKRSSSSLLSRNTTLTPCFTLKTLSLIHCNIQHFESFDYFSKKYPLLSSFALDLFWFSNPTKQDTYADSFKLALHNMLERFTSLSSLSINLSYADMLNKYNLEESLWDHQRFLDWTQERSTHLTSLDLTSHFFMEDNQYGSMMMTDVDGEDQSNGSNDDHNCHMVGMKGHGNQHAYLDYLKELTLRCCSTSIPLTYQYFAQLISNNSISFNALTSLSLIGVESGFRTIMKAKKNATDTPNHLFYMYSWLDLIPNLHRLRLENLVIDNDNLQNNKNDDDDDDDNNDMIKEDEKEEKAEQRDKQAYYPLKELIIEDSYIHLKKRGWGYFCNACPGLRILKLTNSCINYDTDSNISEIIMDAPHITLDELMINKVYGSNNTKKVSMVNKLVLNESTSLFSSSGQLNNDNHISILQSTLPIKDHDVIHFILNCKYADQVNFV
ncbi:hypothetical protein BJ944DRAFT_270861 [Cunninghamella echinulata]|nr:hypothetical protein BJ944DRAFT_270861 [Cunninghamella echinulata]